MSNSYQYVKQNRINTKQAIIEVMGGSCVCCGYNKCEQALELHHLNPNEKDFTFSKNLNKSWESLMEELPKTVLLCANCHREVHNGLIDNSTLKTTFNEEKAKEILEERNKNKKQHNYCKKCHKEISLHATYCSKCAGEEKRVFSRPSREQLKQDIYTMPMVKVGEKYGVTDNTIRKWCISYNLPSRVKEIRNFSEKEWEDV